jgi:hypothetical protein
MIVITCTHILVRRISEMFPLDYDFHIIMARSHISTNRILDMYPLDYLSHSEMYPLNYLSHMIMARTHILVNTNSEMTPLNYLSHEFIWPKGLPLRWGLVFTFRVVSTKCVTGGILPNLVFSIGHMVYYFGRNRNQKVLGQRYHTLQSGTALWVEP